MLEKKDIYKLLDELNIKYNKKKKKEDLLFLLDNILIGKKICSMPMGGYPGGFAKIVEVFPDHSAPEIIFNVHNKNYPEIMGIFDDEKYWIQDL